MLVQVNRQAILFSAVQYFFLRTSTFVLATSTCVVSTLELDILQATVSIAELSTPPLLITSSLLLISPVVPVTEAETMFQDILGMCLISPDERK